MKRIAVAVALLAIAGCSDSAAVTTTTTAATSAAPTTVSTTTTTAPPTTTTTTSTTTTTAPTPTTEAEVTQDRYDEVIVSTFDRITRTPLIELLESQVDVQSVDVVTMDPGPPVSLSIDITSFYSTEDYIADSAWELTRGLAAFWAPDSLFDVDGVAAHLRLPDFDLTLSGITWVCDQEFMRLLADHRASRADWDANC